MKIGINLLYLLPGEVGGTETYGICLVEALPELDTSIAYIVYLNRESSKISIPVSSQVKVINCPVNAKNRIARYLYEQFVLPFHLWKDHIDLVHSLGYVGPLFTHCKKIVTIPDTNFYDVPESFSPLRRVVLALVSELAAKLSDHVLTISEFSKQQIHKHINIPLEKISVTHLGPGWLEKPVPNVDWETLKCRYALPEKYIIAFGGGAQHKNIRRLLAAYEMKMSNHDHSLVIMGHLPQGLKIPSQPTIDPMSARVHCLGFVPTEDIYPLLSHAALFVLPTLYEGFGLPILEAQYAGVPVAASSAASLPEIGGNGAYYFDPTSVESISDAIQHSLRINASEANLLQDAARLNLSRFSWRITAKSTLDAYRNQFT